METHKRYLDVRAIARLANMRLVARLVVEGMVSGLHRSPFHGFNVEFAEHRPYMQGDEIRAVDWKVYAKTDRYFVRQYQEDTNMRALILLDRSGSMDFGTGPLTKKDYASYLSACMAYLMLKQQDSVGLVTFSRGMDTFVPPRSAPSHFNALLKTLESDAPTGETRISDTLHELAERLTRRGLIILISDLLDDPEGVLNGLRHLRHKKHEVMVFHVLDDAELDFPFRGTTRFIDPEGPDTLVTGATELASEYRSLIGEFVETYRTGCLKNFMDYTLLRTSEPYDQALLAYLARRKAQ
ncbi:MAG: DUF58 domain-containing protein [Candidatus Wallbacteria bacterium HGW-Wallbacteria-1]|jgi:uncharacterized protein (DUF58 family)|uniref:DUF58 domain-containing protein n=1 Tax=Candidatus Wallbacteria bacterium HGW-Wallbacteria-1 TaxID=2013854 RepID=A0A2N1PVF1_9BACT|nr:MAG: DUF58 domain-containing protein [Candidatus Wallbacteria bacterium HGW-Wallbacteria-1]